MLKRAKHRMAGESGNVLITVVLVSMIIGALAAAALRTGEHAQTSSASDRNHQAALAVAESGVHDAIAKINDDPFAYMDCPGTGDCTLTASTPEGDYELLVSHVDGSFVLDSDAGSGGDVLGRNRSIRVTLSPPPLFDSAYALFSFTSIDIKNDDEILAGDVWANDSVILRNGTQVNGSVTAATSWIQLESNTSIGGYAWSGGYDDATSKAISMANGSSIGSWAKASVSSPSDPETCDAEVSEQPFYDIAMNGSAAISGEVTTWGEIDPDNGNHGTVLVHECTSAPPIKPLPVFNYNPNNYPPIQDPCPSAGTSCKFDSVSSFQTWLDAGNKGALQGTFIVDEVSPSQLDRIDLTGVTIAGDLTIITNAPVFTNGMDDAGVTDPEGAVMVIVSHFKPPTGSSCDVNEDGSDCAIHVKNNFDFDDGTQTCTTAVLLYADNGPVAVKNTQEMCGSIISEGILIKNKQTLTYDERADRILGFGPVTYEIARWEECPVSGCAP